MLLPLQPMIAAAKLRSVFFVRVKAEKSFPQPEGAPFLISSRSIMHRDSCWHTNILIVG
jgi:hypothetical protein